MTITTYSGYTNVTGETTLTQTIEDIRRGVWLRPIQKIERLMAEGNTEKANKVKGQLPYRTLTGNYRERRLPHSLLRYNPVITLDIDDLTPAQVGPLRQLIKNDPNTLASFLSPRRHGFKFFVYLQTPYAQQLRRATFSGVKELPYTDLERHHALMYAACREYYERLLGVKIDTSGKDIGRGFFVSFDVEAYLNFQLLEKMEEPEVKIVPPLYPGGAEPRPYTRVAPESCSPVGAGLCSAQNAGHSGDPSQAQDDKENVAPYVVMEYRKALATTRRNERFETGNRDMFLFSLGNRCYRKQLPEEDVIALAKQDFNADGFDVAAPIHNAYVYTDKTNEAETKKEDKSQGIRQVVGYLNAHYDIRRNTVMDRLEYACYNKEETDGGDTRQVYRPMRVKDYNSIFLSMQLAGISCYQNHLKAIIDSDYAREYDPFVAYFSG
ncbi:BT4734/BF3469 family protein, partial [Bacteroides sp.]